MHTDFRYKKGFRRLIAWQEAHRFGLAIYKATGAFPKSEQFGMTSQLRRASTSIAAQIVEGSRMETAAHKKSYYVRAYGSAAECDAFLELAKDLQYFSQETYEMLTRHCNRVSYLLMQLKKSLPPEHPTPPVHSLH